MEVSGAGLDFQNLAAGTEGGFLSRGCLLRAGAGRVKEQSLVRMRLGLCGGDYRRCSKVRTAWSTLGG